MALAALMLLAAGRPRAHAPSLPVRLAAINAPPSGAAVSCVVAGATRPLVLLVLGQSNAGNHGASDERAAAGDGPRAKVFTADGCRVVADPLPGATGHHRSIWTQLPRALRERGVDREPVFAVLAVDATTAADWARPGSPLRQRLAEMATRLGSADLWPDRVLWQQGEADALAATAAADYVASFATLRQVLRGAGIHAPIVLAQSTRCGAADGTQVRQALQTLYRRFPDLQAGPDTDAIEGTLRIGCHFTRDGLAVAAGLWADTLAPSLATWRP